MSKDDDGLTQLDELKMNHEVLTGVTEAGWLPWPADASLEEMDAVLEKGLDGSYTLYPPRQQQ